MGDKRVSITAQIDSPRYSKDRKDDRNVLLKLWSLLDEADIVIAHNGKSFDLKKINTRFMILGLPPPSPYRVIDTLIISRNKFKFDSNKLDSLGETLNLGRKVEHEGIDLWLSCMEGDEKAWERMIKYNKQDVVLLEAYYQQLRPWISNHPNLNVINDRVSHCPTCQSPKLQSRGFSYSNSGKKRKYWCSNCHAWSTGKTEKTGVLVRSS